MNGAGRRNEQTRLPRTFDAGDQGAPVERLQSRLSGVQRPIVEDQLGGDSYLWFKFGDFAGWIIETQA